MTLTHELAHLLGAGADRLPVWFEEGIADYIALRDYDRAVGPLPPQLASVVAGWVTDRGLPEALPADRQFEVATPMPERRFRDVEARYFASWLLCTEIADAAGEPALLTVRAELLAGRSVGRALAAVGLTEAELLQGWRARLAEVVESVDVAGRDGPTG